MYLNLVCIAIFGRAFKGPVIGGLLVIPLAAQIETGPDERCPMKPKLTVVWAVDSRACTTTILSKGCNAEGSGVTRVAGTEAQKRLFVKEVNPLYSRTSSARSNTCWGIWRPSCLAAFILITSLNSVGCSTGSSAAFAPFKILST